MKNREFAKTELIHWKGANDDEVEGILYYPTNYDPGQKISSYHRHSRRPDGSRQRLLERFVGIPDSPFTQRGAFILRPNYHGSNDYGLKWAESICCGKYYDLETPDINMGVDY